MKRSEGFMGVDWHTTSTFLAMLGIAAYFTGDILNDFQSTEGLGDYLQRFGKFETALGATIYVIQKSPKVFSMLK